MNLASLFEKRLILLTGKGGVGKSTVASLLGLTASRLGKNTLLVQMNAADQVTPFFEDPLSWQVETPLLPRLSVINLSPKESFKEYVGLQVPFKRLTQAFIGNRFVTHFLDAVPGLNELVMVGKIYDLERQRNKSGGYKYDLIIVDGPATGHGVSAFYVPQVVMNMVKIGPMGNQAAHIVELLSDPKRTALSVVSLAEEMPVVESTELIGQVRKKLHIELGPLFLNNVLLSPFTDEEEKQINKVSSHPKDELYPYFATSQLVIKRAKLNEYYSKELRKKNEGLEMVVIPHSQGGLKTQDDCQEVVEDWIYNLKK